MAKTYGELILECQNFEYSKESYELTKECYELELMSKYIESQEFISDNIVEIRNEFNEFDESYFGESVDENNIELLIESADKKSKNIFKRIWKGIKSIWKKIKGFFAKLFGRSKKTTAKNSESVDKLVAVIDEIIKESSNLENSEEGKSDTTPVEDKKDDTKKEPAEKKEPSTDNKKENDKKDPDKKEAVNGEDNNSTKTVSNKNNAKNISINDIRSILENSWKPEYKNDGYVISPNQPYSRNIKSKTLHKSKNKDILYMLAAAYADTEVVIKVTTTDKKVLSIDKLSFIFDYISEIKNDSNEKEIEEIKKYIKTEINNVMKKGVVIKVDADSIEDIKSKLDNISMKLEEFMKESVDEDDVDLSMFIEGSQAQKKRNKKMANKINGGPKSNGSGGKGMSFDEFKNGGYKDIVKSISGLNEIYSDIMKISGNMMNLYNYVEIYRSSVGNKLDPVIDKYIKK